MTEPHVLECRAPESKAGTCWHSSYRVQGSRTFFSFFHVFFLPPITQNTGTRVGSIHTPAVVEQGRVCLVLVQQHSVAQTSAYDVDLIAMNAAVLGMILRHHSNLMPKLRWALVTNNAAPGCNILSSPHVQIIMSVIICA